jgi:hypothetical protein
MSEPCLKTKNCSTPCEGCGQRPELCHLTPQGFYCSICCPSCTPVAPTRDGGMLWPGREFKSHVRLSNNAASARPRTGTERATGEGATVPGSRVPVGRVAPGNETATGIPGRTTGHKARHSVRELDDTQPAHLPRLPLPVHYSGQRRAPEGAGAIARHPASVPSAPTRPRDSERKERGSL